ILNGIESEGWPSLSDWKIRDWSGGLNRHWFWAENAHPPVFNYINHKFTTAGPTPGSRVAPDVPFGVHRLVFAAAMFTDSALCYSFAAPKSEGEVFGIWDELRQGTEHELGWLGRPVGPAVRLARAEPDLLRGRGDPIGPELVAEFVGRGMAFTPGEDGLTVTSHRDEADSVRFRIRNVPCDGPDLFVSVTTAGQPLKGYPREIARMAWVGIAPPAGRLVLSDPPAAGMCLRGGEETEIVPESGASVRWFPARELGSESHDCYMVHPPYKQTVGYTFWHRDVDVPNGGRLEFFTGMGEKSPERSDGVVFRLLVGEVEGEKTGNHEQVFEHSQKESKWIPHQVSLDRWAGRRVRLKFVADCGPNDNSTTDHAHWGDATVLGREGAGVLTEPVRYMTWVNARKFTSGFYFQDVRSDSVDLEWSVEGTEPITIRSVHVHAHPDAIYREFEYGLVLANPSPRPYEFDLRRLSPGRTYRRLRGSLEQDPATNDGSPVGPTVTLQPKEGLFLVKAE
ncbi:MAG: hypothetical protein HQ582_18425, partial [Planctomycetes bacterium]|nr:hypothetical protein [Planctomycetota bacterium]